LAVGRVHICDKNDVKVCRKSLAIQLPPVVTNRYDITNNGEVRTETENRTQIIMRKPVAYTVHSPSISNIQHYNTNI